MGYHFYDRHGKRCNFFINTDCKFHASIGTGEAVGILHSLVCRGILAFRRFGSGQHHIGVKGTIILADYRFLFRIGSAGGQHCKAHNPGQNADPFLGLFPLCHIFNSSFRVSLAKGQGRTCDDAMSHSKGQQRRGIVCPDTLAQFFNNSFVTAHFHILAGEDKGCPNHRIKPMNAQRSKSKMLRNMVKSSEVVLLMGNDVSHLLYRQIRGKIYLGGKQACNEG